MSGGTSNLPMASDDAVLVPIDQPLRDGLRLAKQELLRTAGETAPGVFALQCLLELERAAASVGLTVGRAREREALLGRWRERALRAEDEIETRRNEGTYV